ncbi:MAG: MBL fold metallo-hydrolase, partial [Deltaproteobacteria bacterium]|nr:MBL fold metallo-hydrolase [Deltaproteobacteria bacterium]
PELAAVAISHDHYDHLDKGAIQQLARNQPTVPFFVPLGVGAHLEQWGVAPERIHEHDWWEEETLADGALKIACAPARHFSGRGIFDRNTTQWASWVVQARQRRVYFGGDSGYFDVLEEIGKRYGPFDLTMLEIGAFHENWGLIHLGPSGALRAHQALGGRYLLPIHWATFNLGIHPWDEPIETLMSAAQAGGVAVLTPKIGERVTLSSPPQPARWWQGLK